MALALEMETGCAASVPVGTSGNSPAIHPNGATLRGLSPVRTGGNSPAIHRWETDRARPSSKSRRDGRTSHRRRGEKRFRPSLQDLQGEGSVAFPAMNRWAISGPSLRDSYCRPSVRDSDYRPSLRDSYYRSSLRDSSERPALHRRRRASDFGPLSVLGCTERLTVQSGQKYNTHRWKRSEAQRLPQKSEKQARHIDH